MAVLRLVVRHLEACADALGLRFCVMLCRRIFVAGMDARAAKAWRADLRILQ